MADDATHCIACDLPLQEGDKYYADISGGFLHAACCGPERECYVDLETGAPISPDDDIPEPSIWTEAAPTAACAHPSVTETIGGPKICDDCGAMV